MITSPSNQRITELHALHAAKGRQTAAAFLLEGPHLLEAALDAHVLPRLIIYDPDALGRNPAGRRLLGRIEDAHASGSAAFAAAPAAIERASDTRAPQGVVAAIAAGAVAPEHVRAQRRGRPRPIVLVLDALSDPGNLGTMLRSALAADVDEALLAPGCADPLAPKVIRAASGAHFHLPIRVGLSWDDIAAQLHGSPAARQVLLAEASARQPYDTFDLTERTAILIGNEAHGPSAWAARLATDRMSIPMWNKVESLNAAVAASVILFEAARQRRARDARPGAAPATELNP